MKLMRLLALVFPWLALQVFAAKIPINCFDKEGVIWEVEFMSDATGEDVYTYGAYELSGETTINGRVALKFWFVYGDKADKELRGYLTCEDEKVYFATPENEEWKLMYDFSLKPGETTEIFTGAPLAFADCAVGYRYFTECLDIAPWQDTEFQIMTLSMGSSGDSDITLQEQWIPGIGTPYGPVQNDYNHWIDGGITLIEVKIGNEVIYKRTNGNSGLTLSDKKPEIYIQTSQVAIDPSLNSRVFDISGREVYGNGGLFNALSKGIYLVIIGESTYKIAVP